MGGDLWVESNYGSGSQFYFTMNLRRFEMDNSEIHEKMQRFKGRNILFLDSLGDQTGVMDVISDLGLRPIRVTSIEEATELNSNPGPNKVAPLIDTVVVDRMIHAEKIREAVHLRYTPIVLVSPETHQLNMKLCIDLGVTGYINSPVNAADLSHALLPALESHTTLPSDSRKSLPLEILLAEDNIVNQKLALRILEKFGHHVKIVSNGKLAVDAFERGTFDLILMDVQMPVMGGFEATQKIRQIELASGTTFRTPIIALTAHAMIGDRDKCLQSGMVRNHCNSDAGDRFRNKILILFLFIFCFIGRICDQTSTTSGVDLCYQEICLPIRSKNDGPSQKMIYISQYVILALFFTYHFIPLYSISYSPLQFIYITLFCHIFFVIFF